MAKKKEIVTPIVRRFIKFFWYRFYERAKSYRGTSTTYTTLKPLMTFFTLFEALPRFNNQIQEAETLTDLSIHEYILNTNQFKPEVVEYSGPQQKILNTYRI